MPLNAAFPILKISICAIDSAYFCGDGTDSIHGVNCATGFTHKVYVRSRSSWRNVFSMYATEPVFFSLDSYTERFKALVVSVHGGDEDCPPRRQDRWNHLEEREM
jgi:hypothetical protein